MWTLQILSGNTNEKGKVQFHQKILPGGQLMDLNQAQNLV